MKNIVLVPELRELLEQKDAENPRDFCESDHPAEIAEMISALEPEEIWQILLYVNPLKRSEIFSHISEEDQLDITEKLSRSDLSKLITDM